MSPDLVRVRCGPPSGKVGRKKGSIEFWPDSIVAEYLTIKHHPRADQKEASDEMDHRCSPRSFSVTRFDPVMSVVRQGFPILSFFPFCPLVMGIRLDHPAMTHQLSRS